MANENKRPEELDENQGKLVADKFDTISTEAPSKTKLNRILAKGQAKDKAQNDLAKQADEKAKKVGFIRLTGAYWLKKWHIAMWVIVFALIASAATALGPWMVKQMTSAIILKNTINDLNNNHIHFDWNSVHDAISWIAQNGKVVKLGAPTGNLAWTQYMGITIGLYVVVAITQFGSTIIAGFLGKRIEIDLRDKTIEKLILQDMSYYSDKKIGDILTKVVSDTQIIGDQSQSIPVAFLNAVFTAIGSVIMIFVIDWKVALVALAVFAIIIIITGSCFGGLRKIMFKVRDVITKINGTVINRISTVQLIKSSGTEEYEKKNFAKLHDKYEYYYRKSITLQTTIITFLIIGVTAIQAILIAATVGIYSNNITHMQEILPSVILAVGIMVGPVMQVVRVVAGMAQASTSAERVAAILYAPKRIDDHLNPGEGIYIDKINGPIVFDNVTFAYPEKPDKVIIPHFDFKFEQGKSYAFVGETGSGKSTISRLLLRFYDPTYGAVLINGDINLKDVHMPSYLEHVGYVEQEPQILLGNVYENVKYGTHGKTNKEVEEACKKAELDKIIKSWPKGYNTVLGERGFMLSGGQKQRLVIARMFLKDPELLILDEATSALDNIVEKEIQGKLNELMKGRTTVSIAHRLSTIKNADEVIVLAPGKGVIQKGTFNELKNKPGHFKDLYEAGGMK